MDFVVLFLGSSKCVSNPYLRSKLVEVIYQATSISLEEVYVPQFYRYLK
jgi:hypothetical protein